MKSTALPIFKKKLCQIFKVFFGCARSIIYVSTHSGIYNTRMTYTRICLLLHVWEQFTLCRDLHGSSAYACFYFTILLYKFALKGNIISVYKGTMKRIFSLHLPFVISVWNEIIQLHCIYIRIRFCLHATIRSDTFTKHFKN